MQFPFPVVVCDVGGTNCRMAAQAAPGEPLIPIGSVKTHDFPGLGAAISSTTSYSPTRPRSVIACGAGPVEDGRVLKLTNAPWIMDGSQIARELSLDAGLLLNDFEAQALSLPALRPEWLHVIGAPVGAMTGVRAILGPGTGLGVGGLIDVGGRLIALASEACHTSFGPGSPEEERLWPHLDRAHGRVTTESVLSGVGLERVHRARLSAAGRTPTSLTAAEITIQALEDRSSEAAITVGLYWTLIARFAGDIALTLKATGGVTLAGGILPRIVDLLDPVVFRRAFEAKAPLEHLAASIPTQLIVHNDSVLGGMAAIAEHPERYGIDYGYRNWA